MIIIQCDKSFIYLAFSLFMLWKRKREVVCGQVWWPILGICALHLTHPSAHTQQWTHTRSSGQPFCGAQGAVGGSVPCSRVSPQSWYWRWREHLLFTPPTDNPCRTWESNLQPLGYKSNSLTIRPRLPCAVFLSVFYHPAPPIMHMLYVSLIKHTRNTSTHCVLLRTSRNTVRTRCFTT